jgi:hypothetical protein
MVIPTNANTIAFVIFEGVTLSFPVGLFESTIVPFTPPVWAAGIYLAAFALCFVALFVWSVIWLWRHPWMALIGFLTLFLVAGFVMPQIDG